jgi:hypothetical protein
MADHGHQNLAFHAAGFKGAAQPNGYTEPLLYRFRAGLEAQTSIRWLPRRIIPLYWKFIQSWAMPNHSLSTRARGRSILTRRPIIGNETGRTSAPFVFRATWNWACLKEGHGRRKWDELVTTFPGHVFTHRRYARTWDQLTVAMSPSTACTCAGQSVGC